MKFWRERDVMGNTARQRPEILSVPVSDISVVRERMAELRRRIVDAVHDLNQTRPPKLKPLENAFRGQTERPGKRDFVDYGYHAAIQVARERIGTALAAEPTELRLGLLTEEPMPSLIAPNLDDCIHEIERELSTRDRIYPRMIQRKLLSIEEVERRNERMRAALDVLKDERLRRMRPCPGSA